MTKIELDELRISKYQELKNNLNSVQEHFRHGDILVRQVNNTLQETKYLIDTLKDTSFTRKDFDDMLDLRNGILAPIFQNASFAVEFNYYRETTEPIEVIPEEVLPIDTTTNNVIDGTLISSTTTTTLGDNVTRTVKITYRDGMVIENSTIQYLKNSTKNIIVKFEENKEFYNVSTLITGNTTETLKTNYENGTAVSVTYTKFVDGLLIETQTT